MTKLIYAFIMITSTIQAQAPTPEALPVIDTCNELDTLQKCGDWFEKYYNDNMNGIHYIHVCDR